MRVRAPAEMLGAVEDLLDAHFEDHVGVSADPRSSCCHVAQERVQSLPRAAVLERIDPRQHAINVCKLGANLVFDFLSIDGGFGFDAKRGKRRKDAVIAIVLRRRGGACVAVATPDDSNFVRFHDARKHDVSFRLRRRRRLGHASLTGRPSHAPWSFLSAETWPIKSVRAGEIA